MSLRVSRVRQASESEWDRSWKICPYASYFQSRQWSEIWSEYTRGRLRPDPVCVEFNDGTNVLLPLTSERVLGRAISRTLSSPAGTYGGWLADSEVSSDHARKITDWLIASHHNLLIRENPYSGCPSMADHRWTQDHTRTLDLAPAWDAITSRWTKGNRSSASKAVRNGILIRRAETERDWLDYFEVYFNSLRRWGSSATSRYEYELFSALWKQSRRDERICLWLATQAGQVLSGAICLYSLRIVVYWHGAMAEGGMGLGVSNLLLKEAILDAHSRKLGWFDFNPSGGHAGVEAFKKSFGSEARSSPYLDTASVGYRAVRIARHTMRVLSGHASAGLAAGVNRS